MQTIAIILQMFANDCMIIKKLIAFKPYQLIIITQSIYVYGKTLQKSKCARVALSAFECHGDGTKDSDRDHPG